MKINRKKLDNSFRRIQTWLFVGFLLIILMDLTVQNCIVNNSISKSKIIDKLDPINPGILPHTSNFTAIGNINGSTFNTPQWIAVNSTGSVYISDSGNKTIEVYNNAQTFQYRITGPYLTIHGIAINKSDYLYGVGTSPVGGPAMYVWYPTGAFDTFYALGASAQDITINSTGYVFTCNPSGSNSQITVYSPLGTFLNYLGNTSVFTQVSGLAFNATDSLFFTDTARHIVRALDSNGNSLLTIGTNGTASSSPGQFNTPTDLAFGPNGMLYVVDQNNSRVEIFNNDYSYNSSLGTYGTGLGQFNLPFGIAIDSHDYVYISDPLNNRIQIYTPLTFPQINVPSDLIYQIKYLGNNAQTWEFANFTVINNYVNYTISCYCYILDAINKTWILNPDFPYQPLTIACTNGTSDIWIPHQAYNGPWAQDDAYGDVADNVSFVNQTWLEMPNLFHFFTFTGYDLSNLYAPQPGRIAALPVGASLNSSYDASSYNVTESFNASTTNPVAQFLLNQSQPAQYTLEYVNVNAAGIMSHYYRSTFNQEFEMELDPTFDPSQCNITSTYWGKNVGDIINVTETINSSTYNDSYQITSIDDCNVHTTIINQYLLSKDPTMEVPASQVYANLLQWNPQLNEWVEQPNPSSFNAQNADITGDYVIGTALWSFGAPFTWNPNATNPLMTEMNDLNMMLIVPQLTGSNQTGFPTDVRMLDKMLPNFNNVTQIGESLRINYLEGTVPMILIISQYSMKIEFTFNGIACYYQSQIDPTTGICNSSGILPSQGGFVQFSTSLISFTPANSSTPTATVPSTFPITWLIYIGIGVGAIVVIVMIVRYSKHKKVPPNT